MIMGTAQAQSSDLGGGKISERRVLLVEDSVVLTRRLVDLLSEPGRIEVVEVETRIACGGVQVRPGDLVGCDNDGIVVVPLEIAAEVAKHAQAILLADMRGRKGLYQRLGMAPDETVDVETVEAYYTGLK